MKNMNATSKIVFLVGIVSVVLGIYKVFSTGVFNNYFFSIFIGVTLIGTAIINSKKEKTS